SFCIPFKPCKSDENCCKKFKCKTTGIVKLCRW
uniref:U5-ctenitoxin-Pn1a n=1 Tax=Phoneutria nigriventer TaxID=6918 RepID=TX29_PHONI|nr:RecName: Full=U5-ctenitoxin-Pn1a; Short=U5-CNTX-Pn1a; AltName: Full=Neurotoxin Tx2-9 [Phoneutria nigriventer]AAB23447.1 neurotoxin Tx2-9 [Phoneutria nigriventer=Brazilian armed spiders, venom, Peptide, 32 aa] [Phoneutria nigriventer]